MRIARTSQESLFTATAVGNPKAGVRQHAWRLLTTTGDAWRMRCETPHMPWAHCLVDAHIVHLEQCAGCVTVRPEDLPALQPNGVVTTTVQT